MGKTQAGFAQAVIEVVKRHAPDFDPATLGMRPRREGKYLLLTCNVRAVSREQLDELYRGLCDHPMATIVLCAAPCKSPRDQPAPSFSRELESRSTAPRTSGTSDSPSMPRPSR